MFSSEIIGKGFLRPDGKKGVRNKVLVVYTVDCASHVAQQIASYFQNLNEDVEVAGHRDCIDNAVNMRRLLSYLIHPNVGASLIIGHGCEYLEAEKMCAFARTQGKRESGWLNIQSAGGTLKTIEWGKEIVSDLLEKTARVPLAPLYIRDLFFGAKCGGSDFTSGLAGNQLVGAFFDRIIDNDGSCVFEEIGEAVGLKNVLSDRGADEKAKREIAGVYDKMILLCKKSGQCFVSPGNFDGGLTTIEEKSMGAVVKSGSRPIRGVLKVAQRPSEKGLWLLDNLHDEYLETGIPAGGDASGLMDMISLGVHFNFLVTGRGHCIGTPVSPTIKITGNPRTYQQMIDDIDINAGQILKGEKSLEQMTDELLEYVISLCAGKKTKAEMQGRHDGEIYKGYQVPDRVIAHEAY